MNRIDGMFAQLKKENRKAFIVYITAGDPDLEGTFKLILELERRGVDLVELGIPFSDPVADGPVNQEAAQRALRHHVTLEDVFGLVRRVRQESQIPLIFFTYLNPVYRLSLERYVELAAESGVDGSLILDLPPEEADDYKRLMDRSGLKTVFLIAPTSPPERIKIIAEVCTGFVYYVSRLGVTGEREDVDVKTGDAVKLIKEYTDLPVCVGFGISRPEHVEKVADVADGVIVGSAIVRRIGEWASHDDYVQQVGDFVAGLVKPLMDRKGVPRGSR